MKAYRILNSIFAAADEQAAIKAWAEHYNEPAFTAGPVEELDVNEHVISIQDEEAGPYRDGKLAEIMPPVGSEAQLLCEGECPDCG